MSVFCKLVAQEPLPGFILAVSPFIVTLRTNPGTSGQVVVFVFYK